MVDLLTIHGPVRDPYLSEFSKRYDLDSGCSVESTLLLHLAVMLTTDTRPTTILQTDARVHVAHEIAVQVNSISSINSASVGSFLMCSVLQSTLQVKVFGCWIRRMGRILHISYSSYPFPGS